ncbi:hypothetical protein UY3_02831 [Chelonia mydas]|uniref:Protein FAM184B n=1 Tax=Chelonia mydas TaxID=8469 RepID=M7BVW7_CHEMY|nr:hypothetical protein UY3_02831 [Chelonia mydas]
MGSVSLRLENARVPRREDRQPSLTSLQKEKAKEAKVLQKEWHNQKTDLQAQEGHNQNQIKFLNEELEKRQNEIAGLKKENSLLKDTMELLSPKMDLQKQESTQLWDKEKKHRLLEEDLKVKHQKELDILKQEHRKEIQNMIADFSSAQAHLQAKIVSLETELKELEEKPRKRESRPEDMHLIGCLQNKLSEREEIIKQLMQKKLNEVPSRVVSVPNLASYAKNFLSCDLRSKRNSPPITKSTSLDQSAGCIRASYPSAQSSDSNQATRTQGNEAPIPKDDQKQDPQHQEWFTKYFSF